MIHADLLLKRLRKVSNDVPCYYLSNLDSCNTSRPGYYFKSSNSIQENIKKIVDRKPKKKYSNLRLNTSVKLTKKHPCLELLQLFKHKPPVTQPNSISLNSSKATIVKSPEKPFNAFKPISKSSKVRYIKISLPSILIS